MTGVAARAAAEITDDAAEQDVSAGLYGNDDGDGYDDENEQDAHLAALEAEAAAAEAAAAKPKAKPRVEDTTPAPEPEPIEIPAGVTYVILEGVTTEHDVAYRHVKTVVARNAEHAAKLATTDYAGDEDLVLVAVPERSWKPMTVAVKVERTITIT